MPARVPREGGPNAPRDSAGPRDVAEIEAYAGEARGVEVQTRGEAEMTPMSPREACGVLEGADDSESSLSLGDLSRRDGAEGETDRTAEGAATAVPIEGHATGGEDGEAPGCNGAVESGRELPLDLVDGDFTVVVFDLETTGLQPKVHRVIELAAKVRRRLVVRLFCFGVAPVGRPPDFAGDSAVKLALSLALTLILR